MSRSMLAAAVLAGLFAASSAAAETDAEFLKGKMVTVVTWQGPGTSYDAFARLLGRHIGKYLPGDPQFRVQLMTGGGGIIAANHLANIASKDGTVLFMVGPGLVVEQAMVLNKTLVAEMREAHEVADKHGDVATASLLENFIDEAERRTWFLFEASRKGDASGH